MSLETRLIALAEAVGTDIKSLTTKQGDLTSLSTTAKDNLVAALNELYGAIGSTGAQIDDTAGTGDTLVTYSVDKILAVIAAAKAAVKSDLLNGAPAALDTLVELANALGNDANFSATLATQMSKRVRYDASQTLNTTEKKQACDNIGVGDPEIDLVSKYAAKKV